jgi:hypothetical protein
MSDMMAAQNGCPPTFTAPPNHSGSCCNFDRRWSGRTITSLRSTCEPPHYDALEECGGLYTRNCSLPARWSLRDPASRAR